MNNKPAVLDENKYRAYLLRLWRGDDPAVTGWRASLEDPRTGERIGFESVLYGMAFDERYRAGVFSEGGIGLKFSNWDAVWYLGPKIRAVDFTRDHQELLAMIAPRAFLLMGGGSAEGEASREFVGAAEPVYRLLGGVGKIQFMKHQRGHAYPPEARKAAEAFLERELGSQSGQ